MWLDRVARKKKYARWAISEGYIADLEVVLFGMP